MDHKECGGNLKSPPAQPCILGTEAIPPEPASRWSQLLIVIVAVVPTAAMAFHLRSSLWRDEAATATITTRPIGKIFALFQHAEGGYAGYLLFMRVWTTIGHSELVLRLPSLVAGGVAIASIGMLALRVAGPIAGITASALVATHPLFMPTYSLEARPYALCTAFVAMSALVAFGISRKRTSGGLLLWSVLSSLAISFHLFAVLAIAPQVLWLWKGRDRHAGRSFVAAVGAPLLTTVVIAVLAARVTVLQSWIPPLSLHDTVRELIPVVSISMLVVLASGLVAMLLMRVHAPREILVDLLVLVGGATSPACGLIVLSAAGTPSVLGRYMLTCVVSTSVLAGVAVSLGWSGVVRKGRSMLSLFVAAILLLAAGAGLVLSIQRGALKALGKPENLRGAAQSISLSSNPGDGILYAPSWAEMGMRWYLGRQHVRGLSDLTARTDSSAAAADDLFTPQIDLPTARARLRKLDRLWIVGYPEINNWKPIPELGYPLAAEIRECGTLLKHGFFGIDVELWDVSTC